jgi:hypothetical protein
MSYTVNGQPGRVSEEPRTVEGQLYVPLADLVEQLGGRVSWDNEGKVATATIGQWVATIRMADRNVDVSGTAVRLSGDPVVDQGTMYVPATFFKDVYGYNVSADASSGNVSISLPG